MSLREETHEARKQGSHECMRRPQGLGAAGGEEVESRVEQDQEKAEGNAAPQAVPMPALPFDHEHFTEEMN